MAMFTVLVSVGSGGNGGPVVADVKSGSVTVEGWLVDRVIVLVLCVGGSVGVGCPVRCVVLLWPFPNVAVLDVSVF